MSHCQRRYIYIGHLITVRSHMVKNFKQLTILKYWFFICIDSQIGLKRTVFLYVNIKIHPHL